MNEEKENIKQETEDSKTEEQVTDVSSDQSENIEEKTEETDILGRLDEMSASNTSAEILLSLDGDLTGSPRSSTSKMSLSKSSIKLVEGMSTLERLYHG